VVTVAGVVAGLVGARLRHAGGRWRIVAVGLAAGAAIPVLIAGSAAVTADAALRRGITDLPPGDRSVVVSYNGLLDRSEAAAVDRDVRSQLPQVAAGPVRRQLIYRAMSDRAGGTFTLGATDGLAAAVRLIDGRLPRSCTPTRCEVVAVPPAGGGAGDPRLPPLGLVVVGHAVRTDPLLLSGTFEPEVGRPLLLADGVDAAASNQALSAFQRTYGWVTPLDIGAVNRLGVTGWIRAGTDMADELWRRRTGLVVTTPDDALAAQETRARSSSRRFALLGGTAGVLLLGAAVAGGAALRHDHARFVGALQRRGASPRQVMAVVVGEVAATSAAGAVLGVALGSGVTAVLAARGDLPVLATVGRAVAVGAPAVLALAALAGVLLAVTLRRAAERDGVDDATWRAVALGAITAAAVAALLAARGGVGVAPEGGAVANDPLLPALPALVLVAAALVAARGWPLMARTMQRLLPRRAIAARLGVGAVAARPLRAAATAALLTAAVGGSVFAGAYRATLERGSGDQAAFAVPTTARVTSGSSGSAPLSVATPADYAAVAPGATAYPVLRLAGSLRVRSVQAEAVQLVGVDPSALTDAARWKAVTGGPNAADVAKGLTPANPPADGRGVALPAGRTLRILTTGSPVTVAVTAWVGGADGRERPVPLAVSPAGPSTPAALTGALPDLGSPLHLLSLTVREVTEDATKRQHAIGEGNRNLAAPSGTITFGAVDVDGRPVIEPWQGWSGRGLEPAEASATLRYVLQGDLLVLDARPGGPGVDVPLPVAADPLTASGGNVTLTLDGQAVLVRPVAVLPRFPTVSGRFVVADRATLARVADHAVPGSGEPTEVWLDVPEAGLPAARAAFAKAPLDRVRATWRADTEHELRTDPVATGAVSLLVGGTALTLAVALAALVLLVVTARYDDAAELYAWEADGVPPRTLRMALWWRAAAVAALAVPTGVVAGLVLARLAARLVSVTAGARDPQPPLAVGMGSGAALLFVVIGLAGALAVAALVAGRSLREPLPVVPRGAG
jgi:hypothetical protein